MLGPLLAFGLAASTPRLVYRPDPARSTDVATVELSLARHPCFGLTRASVLLSSRKADRLRIYALSVTVADSPSTPLPHIKGAVAGPTVLTLVNVRDGDVACTDFQCPVGSSAVFALDEALKAVGAASPVTVAVQTNAGAACDVPIRVDPAVLNVLESWAGKLP